MKSYIYIYSERSDWIILKAHKWTWAKSIFLLDFTIFVISSGGRTGLAPTPGPLPRHVVCYHIHGLADTHAPTLKIILMWTWTSGEIVDSTFRFLLFLYLRSCSFQSTGIIVWWAMAMEKDVILLCIWRWSLRKWHTEERVAENEQKVGLAGERAKPRGRIIFEWI